MVMQKSSVLWMEHLSLEDAVAWVRPNAVLMVTLMGSAAVL